MKLSISRNVLNHLTTVLAQTGAVYTVELADKGLINPEQNEKGFFSDILFFKNIKEKASKTVTVTKTETEVTVALNEELVKDAITLVGTYYQRLAKHVIGAVIEAKAFEKDIKVFQNKWKEEDKPKETIFVVVGGQCPTQQEPSTKDTVSLDLVESGLKVTINDVVILIKNENLSLFKTASNKDVANLAKEYQLPIGVVKRIRIFLRLNNF